MYPMFLEMKTLAVLLYPIPLPIFALILMSALSYLGISSPRVSFCSVERNTWEEGITLWMLEGVGRRGRLGLIKWHFKTVFKMSETEIIKLVPLPANTWKLFQSHTSIIHQSWRMYNLCPFLQDIFIDASRYRTLNNKNNPFKISGWIKYILN